jgi:hypothetical protein
VGDRQSRAASVQPCTLFEMPVPQPPGGTLQVAISGDFDGAPWTNIFHAAVDGYEAAVEADVIGLVHQFYNSYIGAITPEQSSELTALRADGILWQDDGTELLGSYSNPVAGGDGGVVLDASVAVVISWRVAAHWKGGHPRTYIPGIVQDRLDTTRQFSTATVTAFQAAANAFVASVVSLTQGPLSITSLAVLRRFGNGGSETVPKTYLDPPELVPIVSGIARGHIGSQRRRLGHF